MTIQEMKSKENGGCKKIEELYCHNNQITELNLKNNKQFKKLGHDDNVKAIR
ncbi:MAG: hypothetical protein HFJ06_08925 [Lachnospiraceae bacterium]|nr:hypothetical protein [Lachnospiraceae bacterium]